jgi:hypothetical protein
VLLPAKVQFARVNGSSVAKPSCWVPLWLVAVASRAVHMIDGVLWVARDVDRPG